jgi:asparagine synthase (glutamine-hydrolysing)
MCGIFGFILKGELDKGNIDLGIRATNKLFHRGPDNTEYWHSKKKGVFLGHTRLSVIDTSISANQPFVNKNSTLVFNGEIYNFPELKKILQSYGYLFKTSGDTEVLSSLLLKYHDKATKFIDGMFSFAFYQNNNLLLSVDHFGEKPLYWVNNENGFYFSSEPAPLVDLLNLSITNDYSIISEFMLLGQVVAPNTIYSGLKKCGPGEMIKVVRGGKPRVSKYWDIPEQHIGKDRVEKVLDSELDDISEILIDSVRSRTISDVPVGLFLSSGVDSSLIASILSKELHKNDILSMTVSFDESRTHNESHMAEKIARYLKIPHVIVDSNKANYDINSLVDLFGEPNTGFSALSVQQMSLIAKKNFTVALSGNGADEMFFGYGKYQFLYKNRRILTSKIIKTIVSTIPNSFVNNNKVMTLKSLLSVKKSDILLNLKNLPYYHDDRLYKFFTGMGEMYFDNINKENIVLQQRNFDINVNMPGMILPSVDRASMQASLEVRSPFLSKNLAECVAGIDYRKFVAFGQKNVLRSLLSRYLPEKYTNTPKYGFKLPASVLIDSTLNGSGYETSKLLKYSLDESDKHPGWEEFIARLLIMDHYSINIDDIFIE